MKKKGFTLIELLAIIVILAIIALIAVPVVLNIIEKARISSYARSSENVLEAARLYYNEYKLDNTTDIKGNQYDTIKTTLSGELPDSGEVYIKEDGKIALALTYGNYCYKKDYESETFEKSEITDGKCTLTTGITVETLKSNIVTTGDGLYLDSDGVYRYKGKDPNNYITIGEETYRIIAIEEQGIKLINLFGSIGIGLDKGRSIKECTEETCPRYYGDNTYCQNSLSGSVYSGCNIYAKASEIKKENEDCEYGSCSDTITNGSYSGTVTETSTAYKVLHEYYDNTLSELEEHIVTDATWNVGPIDLKYGFEYSEKLLNDVINGEKQWTWQGKIASITTSEILQTSLSNTNTYMYMEDSWLQNVYISTITPFNNNEQITVLGGIQVYADYPAADFYEILPVIYLKSNIQLTGSGSPTDTYKIVQS